MIGKIFEKKIIEYMLEIILTYVIVQDALKKPPVGWCYLSFDL